MAASPYEAKSLGQMTPTERATLTQAQLDAIMDLPGLDPVFRPHGEYHITLHSLRAFERDYAAELQAGEVYEHQLLEAAWCEALPSGEYTCSRAPPNDLEHVVEYAAWAMKVGMRAQAGWQPKP